MPDKSTPVARDLAVLLPAPNASPAAAEFAASPRSPRPQPPDLHRVAEKFAAVRRAAAKNRRQRSGPHAAYPSFAARPGASNAILKSTALRLAASPLATNRRVA